MIKPEDAVIWLTNLLEDIGKIEHNELWHYEQALAEIIEMIRNDSHWIPVTERLPEDSQTVLITHKGGVSFGWYNGGYWERGASTNHRKLQTVIAWMTMPEPYKGDKK